MRQIRLPLAPSDPVVSQGNTGQIVNLFVQPPPKGSFNPYPCLLSTPVSKAVFRLDGGSIGGLLALEQRLYIATPSGLYRAQEVNHQWEIEGEPLIHKSFTPRASGEIPMATNGKQVVLVADGFVHSYDILSGDVKQVNPQTANPLEHCAFAQGVFVYTSKDGVYNSLPFSADFPPPAVAGYAQAEARADGQVCTIAHERQIWLFGTNSIEVWNPTGDAFPFAPTGALIDTVGTQSPSSVVSYLGSVFWVGQNGRVYASGGGTGARRISNDAVDFYLAHTDLTRVRAYAYTERGHSFYCLRTEEASFGFDLDTGLWHQGQRLDDSPLVGGCAATIGHRVFIGSAVNATVLEQGRLLAQDAEAEVLLREFIFDPAKYQRRRARFSEFEIELRTGEVAEGSELSVGLSWSDNNAKDFGAQRVQTLGTSGDYARRCIFRNLGVSRFRVFKVKIYGRGEVSVAAAWVTMSK